MLTVDIYAQNTHSFSHFILVISTAGQDYNQTISSLTFTDQLSLSVPVGIIDDTLFETPESFVGLLSADNLPSNVLLAPTEATGTILDNERMYKACYL